MLHFTSCHYDLTTVWPCCSSPMLCLPAVWDITRLFCALLSLQHESSSVGLSTFCRLDCNSTSSPAWFFICSKAVKYVYTHESTPSINSYYNIVSLRFPINWATLTNLNPAKPRFYPCTCPTVVKHRHRGVRPGRVSSTSSTMACTFMALGGWP